MTRRTRALEREESLRLTNLAVTSACAAGFEFRAGFGAGAGADFTSYRCGQSHLRGLAGERFAQCDFHIEAKVSATLAAGAAARATAAAAHAAKQIIENVGEGGREVVTEDRKSTRLNSSHA